MTNRNTKRALFASAVAMLLCVTMLVGTTYAWFTDTEATGKNIIKSGNLDVELSFYRPADPTAANVDFNNVTWTPVDGSTTVFDENALWEPGYTQVVYFKVENVGSLALKYQISENIYTEKAGTNQADEIFYLSDYLNTYVAMDITAPIADRATAAGLAMGTEGGKIGTEVYESNLMPKGDANGKDVAYGVMVVTMPTTVGNEANHKTGSGFQPEIGLGLTLVATQEMYEDDSFGTEYDEDATYPVVHNVATVEELKDALTIGGNVVLKNDIALTADVLSNNTIIVNEDTVIDLNGYDLDTSASGRRPFELTNGADLTINAGANDEITVGNYGLVYIPDGASNVTLNGGKYIGATDNGAFVKPKGDDAITITLNNVDYTDTSAKNFLIDGSAYAGDDLTIVINGGSYSTWSGIHVHGADLIVDGVDITVEVTAFEVGDGSTAIIKNSDITVTGTIENGQSPNACVAASGVDRNGNGGDVVVENCILNSTQYVFAIYSDDGSSITATGCTISGTTLSRIWEGNGTITVN